MDFQSILSTIVLISCISGPVMFVLCAWLGFLYLRQRVRIKRDKQKQDAHIAVISRTALNAVRETWFEYAKEPKYFSELEVEVKFIYPMMLYLGYKPSDLHMRVNIGIRVGRQDVLGIADWVVYKDDKPYIVIEAKEKGQNLNINTKEQARSYCFALNAPMYILSNGRQIQLYKRGVDSDIMIFNSEVGKLPENWAELYKLIGVVELV